ncbi:hypothetical protein [Variovorax sp. 278MFTsu5.1]|uniref:hypothetical protein n=1 Tax=Variovorax sp. 278MFTsu5.1 TaxID=3158366 RepID=UPI003AAFA281
MKARLFFAALATAALVACGGGGGGGSSFDPGLFSQIPPPPKEPPPKEPPPEEPGPGTNPTPVNAHYKWVTFEQDRDPDVDPAEKRYDDYIALLNREGAAGYRYVEGTLGGNIVRLQDKFMVVKDVDTTYSYEYKTIELDILTPDLLPRLLQQMKDQGAQGKVFVQLMPQLKILPPPNSNPVFGVLYRKDMGSSATYDYNSIPIPTTTVDMVNAANAQGANGFRPWFAPSTINHESAYFFIKDLSSPARYEMKAVISPLSVVGGDFPDVPKQIREQGALGYRLLKERFLTDEGKTSSFFLYMKDLTQASTFEYEFPKANNIYFGLDENNIIQANEQTANGLRYFGNPDEPIFFRSLNCTGALCLSPDNTEIGNQD